MSLETDFIDKAMNLPDEDRAELAERLLLSLPESQIDGSLEAEIERRLGQIDRGEVAVIDYDESITRARQALRRGKAE